MKSRLATIVWLPVVLALASATPPAPAADRLPSAVDRDGAAARHVYFTSGVHNDKGCKPSERCVAKRQPGEPVDPLFPT